MAQSEAVEVAAETTVLPPVLDTPAVEKAVAPAPEPDRATETERQTPQVVEAPAKADRLALPQRSARPVLQQIRKPAPVRPQIAKSERRPVPVKPRVTAHQPQLVWPGDAPVRYR